MITDDEISRILEMKVESEAAPLLWAEVLRLRKLVNNLNDKLQEAIGELDKGNDRD